jgi:hypothetical protein
MVRHRLQRNAKTHVPLQLRAGALEELALTASPPNQCGVRLVGLDTRKGADARHIVVWLRLRFPKFRAECRSFTYGVPYRLHLEPPLPRVNEHQQCAAASILGKPAICTASVLDR